MPSPVPQSLYSSWQIPCRRERVPFPVKTLKENEARRSASSASEADTSTRRNGGKGTHRAPVTPEGNTTETAERHGSKACHRSRARCSNARRRRQPTPSTSSDEESSQSRSRSPRHRQKGRKPRATGDDDSENPGSRSSRRQRIVARENRPLATPAGPGLTECRTRSPNVWTILRRCILAILRLRISLAPN